MCHALHKSFQGTTHMSLLYNLHYASLSISPCCFCFSLDGHLAGVMSLTPIFPLNSAQLRLLGKLNNLRIELL